MPRDEIKIEDKRFWARKDEPDDGVAPDAAPEEARSAPGADPAELEAMRLRAEGAERKLQEIQSTYLAAKLDLERTRERLLRDAEKNVEIQFGRLVGELVESVDDLDRALEHGRSIAAAAPVIQGVAIARERFLTALQKAGVSRIDAVDQPFDPNFAEAVGVVPVSDPAKHDTVVTVVRAGYALAGRVIRPARVLIGRLVS